MPTVNFEAVIFDFGGVFTVSPVEHFAAYEHANGLPERFIGSVIKARINDGAFARFERGEISFEEFDAAFGHETKQAGHKISGEEFVKFLDVSLKPEMVDALRRVKTAGYKTGCITNNFPSMESDGSPRNEERGAVLEEIFSLFDHVIESSVVGIRKPELEIYRMMCDKLGALPSKCIFIDDLGMNLKPAKLLGMRTIKAPIGNVTPAIEELYSLMGVTT